MRDPGKDKIRLEHIVQSIERIKRYTSEKGFDDFVADDMMYYAVVKNLEIIGEEANLLTNDFKNEHLNTPWKLVIGMRNYIVHEYFQVDNTVIWEVIQNDLPILASQIKDYLKEF